MITMADDANVLRIRAHHLLCMQGFQGYGYDKNFVNNLYLIMNQIDNNPDLELELVAEIDEICSKCPNNKDEECLREPGAEEKIKKLDGLVLKKLGLEAGARVKVDEIIDMINEQFKSYSDIEPVCGDCEWKKECLFLLSKTFNM
jgi:hypothetical protein